MFYFGAECFENGYVVRCRLVLPCYPLIRAQGLKREGRYPLSGLEGGVKFH